MKTALFIGLSVGLLSSSLFAEQRAPLKASIENSIEAEEPILGVGVMFGGQANPANVLIASHLDLHVSKWLSFGPLTQLGLSRDTTFFLLTGGGKIHIPTFIDKMEGTFQAGAGYFYRSEQSVDSNNFVFFNWCRS